MPDAPVTIEKSASGGRVAGNLLGRGIRSLFRNGLWGTAAKLADRGVQAGRFVRPLTGVRGVARVMSGKPGKYLGYYGMAGLGAELLGHRLPGANLAWNMAMPGYAALFAAPGAVTSARLTGPGVQGRIADDAQLGAREAAHDFLTSLNYDPRVAYQPGAYADFMRQHGGGTAMADQYLQGAYNPMGTLKQLGAVLGNPQELVNDQIDKQIYGLLHKQGSLRKSARPIAKLLGGAWKTSRKVMPYAIPAFAGIGIVNAATRKNPYDVAQVQQRGYAGAQAALQQKLSQMSGWQRMAARLDPTLVAGKMEEQFPGLLAEWQERTGETYRPGLISRIVGNWQRGGPSRYYTFDAAGRPHYIE